MLLQEKKFSLLELASVRENGSITETLRDSLRYAQKADELGFERFWLAEHHNMEGIASAATSVLIGYIAGGTERIKVGSGGIMLPNHPPLVIAEQFGTLASLYPGRIELGLAVVGGPDTVREGLETLCRELPVDEFMFAIDVYDPNQRQRALEILAVQIG